MFIALTIGQLFVEQLVVQSICEIQAKTPGLKNRTPFYKLHAKFTFINLGFSLLLSLALATMFPAAGMIVLASGLVSTMLSMPFAFCMETGRKIKVWFETDVKPFFAEMRRIATQIAGVIRTIVKVCKTIRHPIISTKARFSS